MATGAEIAIIASFINKATAFASGLSANWYKGSKELEEFPEKITALRIKHHFWKTQLKRYGMTADQLVAPLVLSAVKKLEQEERRLQRCNDSGRCMRLWRKFNYLVFPGQLTLSVQAVIDGFDNIPLMLKGSKEHLTQLEQTKSDKVLKLPFGLDARYVPLEATLVRVRDALEDRAAPARSRSRSRLVLLYGGPGAGKSNVALFAALHYQARMLLHHDRHRQVLHQSSLVQRRCADSHTRQPSHADESQRKSSSSATDKDLSGPDKESHGQQPPDISSSQTGWRDAGCVTADEDDAAAHAPQDIAGASMGTRFVDGVFYLHCGEGAALICKQLELLQGLGFAPKGDAGKELTSEKAIRKHLLLHLEEQDVLIVLDDVWDSSLIQGLITPGKRVRYLVTSQNARLWEDAVAIEIEQVSLELGRRILSAHIGIPHDEFPAHLQEIEPGVAAV
ncbi:hypothetical protein Mapa_013928 [Marchantia paleacea]|nr:hypothetical protein Mapa_013928 [Marchantia paleacea]